MPIRVSNINNQLLFDQLIFFSGILVPGGFGDRGIEGMVAAIKWAREKKKPFLGVCLGLQCSVIEFARNVLNWEDANSTEVDPNTTKAVVIDMPEHNPGTLGGTMRLGKKTTIFNSENSILRSLYGGLKEIDERHRHRYEVNPVYIKDFENAGLKFVGKNDTGDRMEVIELESSVHPYFVGVQFHPEYLSRPLKPSPPYLGLILASCNKLTSYTNRNCRFSPSHGNGDDSDEEEISSFFNETSIKT